MVEAGKYVPCGNSRDPPTPFLYFCSKGCGHSKELRYKVVHHEINCDGQSTDRLFKCQRSGCQKSFKTDMSLRVHVGDVHDFKPIACDKCPDQSTTVYETKRELKKHQDAVHCVVEKQHCPLQEHCGFSNEYTRKTLLRQHLRRKHHLTNEQIKEYVPDGRKGHSNIKGKKRKPKGWHLAAGGVEKDEALDESGGDMSSDGDKEDEE
ncbi:hypothetical protein V498_08733 [Pseudogymnoascus sp. VKM F-4517 (FW-2822)]|nr:hypothetical protein V498_08733 [Pseudogymnoascus sp. VKM F-4517 (FW-2822)]